MTSDKYIHAVRPFLWLMTKYWRPAPKVVVAGYSLPPFGLSENAMFISLGKFEDYPIGRWSDSLHKALSMIPDKHIIIMLEDYWIVHPVDTRAVSLAEDYMVKHPEVIKFDLCADRLYAKDANLHYGKHGFLDLVKSKPGSPYHLSLMTGIWNKGHLMSILKPAWSPWDIEIDGTRVLSTMPELVVVGSHQWPIKHTLAFRGGDENKLILGELHFQDQQALRAAGLFDPWEKPKDGD